MVSPNYRAVMESYEKAQDVALAKQKGSGAKQPALRHAARRGVATRIISRVGL